MDKSDKLEKSFAHLHSLAEKELKRRGVDLKAKKRPRDPNQLAKSIVDLATGEAEEIPVLESARKGGLKGGKARAKALTPEQRSEIASAAAQARWKKDN